MKIWLAWFFTAVWTGVCLGMIVTAFIWNAWAAGWALLGAGCLLYGYQEPIKAKIRKGT